jgi:hypothetical protein
MAGDNGSRRLVKFWWVLFATIGATGGAVAASFCGLNNTIWGILGLGLPIGAAFVVIESRATHRTPMARKAWPDTKYRQTPPRRSYGYKVPPRRGQLHAITRRKTAEPPSSGGG